MHAKNNRVNKDFQITYFLAGSCFTPDGAYSLLKDLQEDREMALAQLESSDLRTQAKVLQAKRMLESDDEVIRLEGQADLSEINNNQVFGDRNIKAAKKELDFINSCIDKLQPYRKFSHLPDDEAHEAAQYDEWKLELINRAENYLITTGNIPTDHFITMRQHPEFVHEILPAIDKISATLAKGDPLPVAIANLRKDSVDVVALLDLRS